MRSVESRAPSATEPDLTARARIRDAAVAAFPVNGFSRTTVRAIATTADVSPALVIHYFGSKENLRASCDEHVIRRLSELRRASLDDGMYRSGDAVAASYRLIEPELRYLAWALRSGGPASEHIFDLLLDDAVAQLGEYRAQGHAEIDDVQTLAAVLLAMRLGGLVLHEHLTRTVGVDTLSAAGLLEMAPHALRIFSGELFDQVLIADAARALRDFNETN